MHSLEGVWDLRVIGDPSSCVEVAVSHCTAFQSLHKCSRVHWQQQMQSKYTYIAIACLKLNVLTDSEVVETYLIHYKSSGSG